VIRDHARRHRLRTHDVCRAVLAGERLMPGPSRRPAEHATHPES
jgi:hypothetical protein